MQAYDIPSMDIVSRPADTVTRRRQKKSKALTFFSWQATCLTLVAYVLTGLRYYGLLSPLTQWLQGLVGG